MASAEINQKLQNLQTLISIKAELLSKREQIRFQYLSEWRNRLETAIGAITYLLYSQINDYADANLLFSAFSRDLFRSIPMTALDGRPYLSPDGKAVYKLPWSDVSPWVLGGAHSVSFLGPIDSWITQPFYDDENAPKAPAYKINEQLIKLNAVAPIMSQWSSLKFPMRDFDGVSVPWFADYVLRIPSLKNLNQNSLNNTISVVLTYINWQYMQAPILGDTLNKVMIDGAKLYSDLISATREVLMSQLTVDAAEEIIQNSMIESSLS